MDNFAERMKMKKPHTIPLTEETYTILEVMKPISQHHEFVFPSHRDPRKHSNSQTANIAIKRMGFAGELVPHGLANIIYSLSLLVFNLNKCDLDFAIFKFMLSRIKRDNYEKC